MAGLDSLYTRSPLKWAGSKFQLLQHILPQLPQGKRMVEPLAGSAVVALNSNFPQYWLNDCNKDVIALYQIVRDRFDVLIAICEDLFIAENNSADNFYRLRENFNQTTEPLLRSALFLYLNRHCFNGLCRYNKSGLFNVPFGRYKKIDLPLKQLRRLQQIVQTDGTLLTSYDFSEVLAQCGAEDVVYCDPPYAPLQQISNFTTYNHGETFTLQHQQMLHEDIIAAKERGAWVVISNHDTEFTRDLYQDADQIISLQVQRNISAQAADRSKKIGEILALYQPTGMAGSNKLSA